MSITRAIVRNQHAVWAAIIAAFLFGVVGYMQLPVRLFPDTAPPLVNVVTPWPGAAASDIERDLSRVLEEEFASLEGVTILSSTSQDNLSMISVEFQYDVSSDLAAVDVQNAIARIGQDLPAGAEQPRVMTFSTSNRPIYTVGIAADDMVEARRLAEDVFGPLLQRVEGVAAVDVFGGHVPGVLVEVDPQAAEAHRIPVQAVAQAIVTTNVSLPAGRLRGSSLETMLRVDQRVSRVEALEELSLAAPGGSQVHLDDLATVTRTALDDDTVFSIDGQRAIALQVFGSEDANTVDVVGKVQVEVSAAAAAYPEIRFIPGEESASFTEQSVSNLLGNVGQALVLASIILFLFLGRVRSSLVTILSMPLSYGITFGVMNALGMELNMVTLTAVILAVGMVVDATVVVLENIIRLREEEGLSPLEAAIQGTDEVILPVLAGAATTMIVLVPLLGLQGFVGKTFGPLAATLLIAFSSSVLVALIAVPVLSQYTRDGGRLDQLAGRVASPFQRATEALRRGYMAMLDLGLRRPAVIVIVAVFFFVLGLIGLRTAGMEMLPQMDSGAFSVSLETPSGSSLAQTAEVVAKVERLILEQPDVTLVQAQAGYEPGMLYTGGTGVMGPTQGFLSVTLTPRTDRDTTIWEIEDEIRAGMAHIPGIANAVVKEVGNTAKATTAAPVIARLSGPDTLVLDRLGDEVRERLSTVDGVVAPTRAWNRDMERVTLQIDEQQALALGHGVLSVAQTLTTGANGIPAGSFDPGQGSPEPILVRYKRSANPELDELLAWPLFVASSGQVLPLRSVAHAERSTEQGLFTSRNLSPTLDVLAGVAGRPLSFVVADAEAAINEQIVPEGYSLSIAGENSDLQDARGQILGALGVSIIAVYLLLAAQFRSFVHPIIVMMAVPLSLAGVSAALFLTGKPVSMPVMVGLVLLVGTVVNNSIILVDIIRQRREAGVERRDAIREGVSTRFRPILMTSLSTMVGMVPLAMEWALGAERFSPLAIAVIGGLLASTLLTLVVIPVLYELSERILTRGALSQVAQGAAALLLVGAMALSPAAQAAELSLEEAWGLVTSNHPAMEASEARLDSAKASAAAATGRMLPQAQVTTRYSRLSYVEPALLEIPITMPTGETVDPIQFGESVQNQYSFRVAAQQPLFAGGALFQGRRAATAGVDRMKAERDVTATALWASLVESWYGLAVARNMERIQAELLEAAIAQEQRIQRLVEQERATELQLASVSLKRAEAQQALASAEANTSLAEHGLTVLTGREPPEVMADPITTALALSLWERADPAQRPEVAATAAGVRATEAVARAKVGAMVPSLALAAGYQYENPNSRYFPIQEEWNDSWDASVVLSWNLDAGLRLNEARAARADAAAARAGLRALRDETELRQTQTEIETLQWTEQLGLAAERVRLAERAALATQTAMEAGRLTTTDYLERRADLALAHAVQQHTVLSLILSHERQRGLTGSYGPR
ncbi:MAG: TolC family protein [Victivallales bacterium]|nr:TolC family protein [Victivallales bacterium]